MTEPDWIASADPAAMLGAITAMQPSDRKLRLWVCACARQVWDKLTDERSRHAVLVAERYADGLAAAGELEAALRYACDASPHGNDSAAALAVWASGCMLEAAVNAASNRSVPAALQATLLRDVVGSPFRPLSLPEKVTRCGRCGADRCTHESGECRCADCGADAWVASQGWVSPTVLVVALAAYEERSSPCTGRTDDGTLDPEQLLVLADALEESGCTDERILRHLRGQELCRKCLGTGFGGDHYQDWDRGGKLVTCSQCDSTGWRPLGGPHVRGCAVLDAILGKE